MEWLNIFNFVIGLLFSLCYLYQYVYMIIACVRKPKRFPETDQRYRYAVLISARNERAVIGQLLDSIRAQDYPAELIDTFVIADNCTDDTAEVAERHGATVYKRNDTANVGKGYALKFVFDRLKEEKGDCYYDGYFVIDADNLLEKDYVSEMNKAFAAGHRVVTSYRNSKNYGDNWISSGYSLWFLREARHLNSVRFLIGTSCVVAGTGFLVSSEIIREQGGWKHFSMTEDTEFTAERMLMGERIAYCHDAVFYDEQPVKFSQSWRQRKRWAKGYLQVLARLGGKMTKAILHGNFSCFDLIMSLSPAFIISLVTISVNLVAALVAAFVAPASVLPILLGLLTTALAAYALFFLVSLCTVILEWKRIRTSTAKKILSVFTTPLFIATYIPISASALFSKVEWKPIEHKVAVSVDELKQPKNNKR